MTQRIDRLKETPSQTAGPYVHIGLTPNLCDIRGIYPSDLGRDMVGAETTGTRIAVSGRIFDGAETPLRDAMVEIWQADANGSYPGTDGADPAFTGWGRAATDMSTGAYRFDTIRPGAVPMHDGRMMNPHITFWILARGINLGLHTRMYFPEDDPGSDPVLSRIEHQARVKTLIAAAAEDGHYHFDIHLQGADETVFFDI